MLEIHIAKTFDAASQNDPVCTFSFDVHQMIFFRENVPIGRFPLLLRTRDYCSDSSFTESELPALLQEAQTLINLLPPKNEMITTLEALISACHVAITKHQNLYFICD
jgi:hypothetical protein